MYEGLISAYAAKESSESLFRAELLILAFPIPPGDVGWLQLGPTQPGDQSSQ
jgi:hypothetical protein